MAKDKKTLYVVRGGRFLSINSDHAQIAAFEGEFKNSEMDKNNSGGYDTA